MHRLLLLLLFSFIFCGGREVLVADQWGESVNLLLIHCMMAGMLWNFALRSFGIQWVFPNRLLDLLDGWWNLHGTQSHPACCGQYGGNATIALSRTWRKQRISLWSVLFPYYLSGPVHGVSHLALLMCSFFLLCL